MENVSQESKLIPKNKWLRTIFYVVLLISSFITILVVVSLFVSCFRALDTICENTFPEVYYSPSGTYKAIYFLRNCGATDGYEPGVSVLPADEEFDIHNVGNVYQCYRCGCTHVSWLSEDELLIQYCWPSGTGFTFESPDDFLKVHEKTIYDIEIKFELVEN